MENEEALIEVLEKGEVKIGDTLMVHSSYSPIKSFFANPDALINDLLKYLGPEGTLLIPTFNFSSWTNGHYFDIEETPSEMGILTETARMRNDGKRTKHPIYSFMVFGKHQETFFNCDDKEAFGGNSVFALFHEMNGQIMSIGLSFNSSFSLHHYVELKAGIDYRRIKEFSGIYVDNLRIPKIKLYSMFVRANIKYKTIISPGLEILQAKKVIKDLYFHGVKIDFCRAKVYYDNIYDMVISNPELFYEKG